MTNVIRYAKKEEETEIKRLFNACFPHEEKFCEYFFDRYFKAENTIVDFEGNKLRGSAMELPYRIEGLGEVTYLYAVGTSPEYRGKGVCREILEFSHNEDIKKGRKASVLIPQNEPLFRFYEKLGYKTAAYVSEEKYKAAQLPKGYRIGNCSPSQLKAVYEKSLEKSYILRSEEYFKGQLDMFSRFGGGCLGLFKDEEILSYCFYSVEEGKLTLDEAVGEEVSFLAEAAALKLGFEGCIARSKGKSLPFGMAYFYDGVYRKIYMNLMFN